MTVDSNTCEKKETTHLEPDFYYPDKKFTLPNPTDDAIAEFCSYNDQDSWASEEEWYREVILKKSSKKKLRYCQYTENNYQQPSPKASSGQSTADETPCDISVQLNEVNDLDEDIPYPENNTKKYFEISTCGNEKLNEDDQRSLIAHCKYALSLVEYILCSDTFRGKQAQVTLWELLEHFDFVNDFVFIFRVYFMMTQPDVYDKEQLQKIAFMTVICLVSIYVISLVAYGTRRWTIYHHISSTNSRIFSPIIVFEQIRFLENTSPETLYMFQRVSWTYQVMMRFIEDIPQLLISTLFLINFGQSIYTYFMIAYSFILMLITSIRMGLSYPLCGTISLVFTSTPPVDSPTINAASPITRHFFLFLAFTFAVWSFANIACAQVALRFGSLFFYTGAFIATILTVLCGIYWLYLNHEARQDLRKQSAVESHLLEEEGLETYSLTYRF